MIDRFHVVPDAAVVIRNCMKGGCTYRQCNVYTRGLNIYVGVSKDTFAQLYADGNTSHPSLRWDDLELPFEEVKGKQGRLEVPFSYRPEAKIIEHKAA